MRVLIAADSFKDALPAAAVCAAIAKGLRERSPAIESIEFPLADGGDGMLDVLTHHLALTRVDVPTLDPLFRPIKAPIGISADGSLAVIEMARASGIQLLKQDERNALKTTTLGTGKLIAAAVSRGAKRIILGIGGSATHDMGMGAAVALGWRFLDRNGLEILPIGSKLHEVARIIVPEHPLGIRIDVLCDVTNPLLGSSGAAHVYARQKGASEQAIEQLELGSTHFAGCVRSQINSTVSPDVPGAGAAGGLGFGSMVFMNASLQRGVETMLDLAAFDRALDSVDLVITGEGKLDSQTLQGKLIAGVCTRAAKQKIPVIALVGELTASEEQIRALRLRAAYCINTTPKSKSEMLRETAANLAAAASRLPLPLN